MLNISMQQNGVTLITTLLILFVLSLLVMGSLESFWLEHKMSSNFAHYVQALHYADQGLQQVESQLKQGIMPKSDHQTNYSYQVNLQAEDQCGRKSVLVNARGYQSHITIWLQTLYIMVPPVMSKLCQDKVLSSRQIWWREIF